MVQNQRSPLQVIRGAYDGALKFGADDRLIVDAFVAVLTAAFHKGLDESVWMYFCGPAGSGKTETVMPIRGHDGVVLLTTPTENALISGYSDETTDDPSLIRQLDGKVLIWKDFTALMDAGRNLIDKVQGEFRDCYDQYCSKASGKAGLREYEARFGMIACVTGRIDSFAEDHQQLGQRFLMFRINRLKASHKERVENLGQIVDSMKGKKAWKNKLKMIVHLQVDRIRKICEKGVVPTISAGAEQQVKVLADLLALGRTAAIRDIAVRPELATRAVQQLLNLGHAHAVADGRTMWNDSDMALVRRVMLDSLPLVRQRLLTFLYRSGSFRPAMPVEQLASKCGTIPSEMGKITNQYYFSGILDIDDTSKEGKPWYRLSQDIYSAIAYTEVLK